METQKAGRFPKFKLDRTAENMAAPSLESDSAWLLRIVSCWNSSMAFSSFSVERSMTEAISN